MTTFRSKFCAEPLDAGESLALAQHRDRLDDLCPDWTTDDLDLLADPRVGLLDSVVWWVLSRPKTEAALLETLAAKHLSDRLVRLALGNLVRLQLAACTDGVYHRLTGGLAVAADPDGGRAR